MLKPNGSREDMRISKETDVTKLSEAVAIQLRRTGRCRLRASGDTTVQMAWRVIMRQRPYPHIDIHDEDVQIDEKNFIKITVFELTASDGDA